MLLKRLSATGFKSFADRTELDFGPGITCIVGPNGCGKSNVVDAIKWVLGEQSAKSLRGRQMMDVIFNGSGTRKSSGVAQVDLTFDNSDGLLETDQTEVVVSRRLYRSGESEYLLNNQVCRLKDVRELFLDTGVGIDAYSVIEQGRVDVLLQANPSDRRQIFEEAAGISKYKVRKKEAQRRLERVNQNLLRVQDIIEEIEKRLRSVKLAAGKARNYQSYTERLRALRSTYALAEYHRLATSAQEEDRASQKLSDEATALRTRLSAVEAESSETTVRIVALETELSEVEGRLLTTQSQISAQEERIAGAQRRIADQTELHARSQQRLAEWAAQAKELDAKGEALRAQHASLEDELGTSQKALAEHQEQDRTVAMEAVETQRRLEDEKAGLLELVRRTGQLHNEIQALSLQHETIARERDKLSERDSAVADELAEAMARQQDLSAHRDRVLDLIEDQTKKLEEMRLELAEAAHQRSALVDQHVAAKEYRSGLESRRQLLDEMDRRHEGLLTGAREILQRRDDARAQAGEGAKDAAFGYVLGAVGELFEADVAHAGIVEAVLGPYEKYLVVERRDRFLADRDQLADLSGPVRAFCLDAVGPAMGGPDLSGQEGYIARLIDWVQCPAACMPLARHLLGRTYVVESIEDARRMAALDGGARFATMDGYVWDSDGRLGLGPLGSGTGLISRRSELRELEKQLGEVGQRIERISAELAERESHATHIEASMQTLRGAMAEANTQHVEVRSQLAAAEEVVARLGSERPLIASELNELVGRLTEMGEREASRKAGLAELETQNAQREREVAALAAALDAAAAKRQELGEAITALRVRVGELTQQRASAARAIGEADHARQMIQGDLERGRSDVTAAAERIEESQRQLVAAKAALAELGEQQRALGDRSRELREGRDGHRQRVEELAHEAKRLRGEIEEVEARLHERQMRLGELRVRIEDLCARVREELSVELAEQYANYRPDESQDWPAVEEEIESLRQKIERLGNVNLDAITEQEELETRLAFLTGQATDLRESERQLAALIEKLDEESRQRFLETFNAVATHFSALFKKLFGGGRAELTLMDPLDVLECGIEIMARPPGKEPQSISLLSGGEKTMTAIALLLAVFQSRPSPFVLLDEVDAALDEANNVRFNHVIQEFVKHSQFIIITHAKRTMSIADVLYGITMQEAGVSKRVSVHFEEEPQRASA